MYGKVFASMYDGTLYGHWQAIVAFQQMIVLCDADGVVDMTPQAMAARTSIPLEIIQAGIEILEQPDPYTRTPGDDGRRILRLDAHRPWGWKIVNYLHYRYLVDAETVRAQNRERQRRHRDKPSRSVTDGNGVSREVTHVTESNASSRHAEAEAEADKNAGAKSAPLILHASLPHESWSEWLAHRREKRLSMSPRALNKQLKLLAEYPTAIQREIIDTSINAGWEGLFKPKGRAEKTHGKSEWM